MSLENFKSEDALAQKSLQSASSTTSSQRRLRRVNWTANSEPETYHTVVINYHFAKEDNAVEQAEKAETGSESASTPKKPRSWKQTVNAVRNKTKGYKRDNSSDVELNLGTLYESPTLELAESSAMESDSSDEQKIYNKDQMQQTEVIIEEQVLKSTAKTAEDIDEVIVISDVDDVDGSVEIKVANETNLPRNFSKTTSMMSHQSYNGQSKTSDDPIKMLPRDSFENIEEKLKIKLTLPEVPSSSSSQRLRLKWKPINSFKQRQLELHQYRISVEQKRLELLQVKLTRERDEMMREQMLFDKELELKASQLRQLEEEDKN